MKRIITVISALMLFWCVSCADNNSPAPAEFEKPTFYLSELPDIEPFEIAPEIKSRYGGEEYSDKLKPADDYGKLYPYEGARQRAAGYGYISRYGLVDAKGRIVVDPVYEYAYYGGPDMDYLCLYYPQERINPLGDPAGMYEERPKRIVVAKADGSFVSDDYFGSGASMSEDRIIIGSYSTGDGMQTPDFKIYDLDGGLLFEGDGYFQGFFEDLGIVQVVEYDRQVQKEKWWYQYIDRDGRVVIPGPFLDARPFKDGEAFVSVGEEWETALYGVIGTNGNYITPPSMRWSEFNEIFLESQEYSYTYGDSGLQGIMDNNGNIVVPVMYNWVMMDSENTAAIAGNSRGASGEFFIYDLKNGEKRKIDGKVSYVNLLGNGWWMIEYEQEANGTGHITILKGDIEYIFEYPYGQSMYCDFIRDSLLALNYYGSGAEKNGDYQRTDIFDADSGEILKSLPGLHYQYGIEDRLYTFYSENSERIVVLDQNFKPLFPEGTFGASDSLTGFQPLTDGIYQARTVFSSGLLKENGEWLIRVNISSTD